MPMQIKFTISETNALAGQYLLRNKPKRIILEARIETMHALEVQRRGYYTKAEMMDILYWKVPGMRDRASVNEEESVISISRAALAADDEVDRITGLILLQGVSWVSASVLLHFGSKERYPILDQNSCRAAGYDYRGGFDLQDWLEYVKTCRSFAAEAKVSMRTLDRALQQFAKKN